MMEWLRRFWRRPADRISITVTHKTMDSQTGMGNLETVQMSTTAPARTGIVELRNLTGKLGAACSGRRFDGNRDALALRDWMRNYEMEKLGVERKKPVVHLPDETQLSIDAQCWKEFEAQMKAQEENEPDLNISRTASGKGNGAGEGAEARDS